MLGSVSGHLSGTGVYRHAGAGKGCKPLLARLQRTLGCISEIQVLQRSSVLTPRRPIR